MIRAFHSVLPAIALVAALASAILPEAAIAQSTPDPSSVKATIANLEDQWLHALLTADVKTIDAILAPDFVRPAPESKQFVAKSELLAYYRSRLVPRDPKSKRIDDMTVSVYGTTAIARGHLTTFDAKGGIVSKLLFTDVFVQRDGKWQAVSAQENPIS